MFDLKCSSNYYLGNFLWVEHNNEGIDDTIYGLKSVTSFGEFRLPKVCRILLCQRPLRYKTYIVIMFSRLLKITWKQFILLIVSIHSTYSNCFQRPSKTITSSLTLYSQSQMTTVRNKTKWYCIKICIIYGILSNIYTSIHITNYNKQGIFQSVK